MKRIALAAFLLTGACASDIMQGYVGKPVEEPILDYGPPANVVEMSDGRRAYQWKIRSSGAFPIVTPTTSTIYGSGGVATIQSQTTSYVPFESDCLYTLTAARQGQTYVVDGFRKPRLGCE